MSPSIILRPFLLSPKNEKRKKVQEHRSLKFQSLLQKPPKERSFKNQYEMIPESTSLKRKMKRVQNLQKEISLKP
jgi:hypothetical protein